MREPFWPWQQPDYDISAMDPVELKTRLQFVEHDLEHVVRERNDLAALVRRQAAALAAVEAAVAEWDTEYRGPLNRWATVNVLRAALAAGDDGQAAHPCPGCGCMCSPAEAMCWRCGAVQPEEGQS